MADEGPEVSVLMTHYLYFLRKEGIKKDLLVNFHQKAIRLVKMYR